MYTYMFTCISITIDNAWVRDDFVSILQSAVACRAMSSEALHRRTAQPFCLASCSVSYESIWDVTQPQIRPTRTRNVFRGEHNVQTVVSPRSIPDPCDVAFAYIAECLALEGVFVFSENFWRGQFSNHSWSDPEVFVHAMCMHLWIYLGSCSMRVQRKSWHTL